jgi:hypothetical protein
LTKARSKAVKKERLPEKLSILSSNSPKRASFTSPQEVLDAIVVLLKFITKTLFPVSGGRISAGPKNVKKRYSVLRK